MPAKRPCRREMTRGAPTSVVHGLHSTVDVLELAARYVPPTDAQRVSPELVHLSAVNVACRTAVGNVAAEELVQRHCVVDVVDELRHERIIAASLLSSTLVLKRHFEKLDADTTTTGVELPPLRLRLSFNQWHQSFPAHMATLLLASRGRGPGHSRLMNRIRALAVTTGAVVSLANRRGFEALLRVLNGQGASLFGGLRTLRLQQYDGRHKIACETTQPPSVLEVLDTALELSAVSLLDVDILPEAHATLKMFDLLQRFPALRSFVYAGPVVVGDATPCSCFALCRRLVNLSVNVTGKSTDSEAFARFVAQLPTQHPQLRAISVMGEPEVTEPAFEALCTSVADCRSSQGTPTAALALTDIWFSSDLCFDANWKAFKDWSNRSGRVVAGLLRSLPTLRTCESTYGSALRNIAAVAAADRTVTYAFESVSVDLADVRVDGLQQLLRQLPCLRVIELDVQAVADEGTLVAALGAVATYRNPLSSIRFRGWEAPRSDPLESGVNAMLDMHCTSLRELEPEEWFRATRAGRNCAGLRERWNSMLTFLDHPEAPLPLTDHVNLSELLEDADWDAEVACEYIENHGQPREAVRDLFLGDVLPKPHRHLLLAAARRCPNVTHLSVPGKMDTATFRQVLPLLPRLRCLTFTHPFGRLNELLTVLTAPHAPQLTMIGLVWPTDDTRNDYVRPRREAEAARSTLEHFLMMHQPHLERCDA